MSFYQSYCSALKKQTGYFACWLPNSLFSLGDFGTIKENVFTRLGNISDFGFSDPFSTQEANPFTIQSEEVAISYINAEATIPSAPFVIASDFLIKFNKENSFYLSVKDCSISKFDNIINLGKKILSKKEYSEWQDDWHVITELLTAGKGMIYISSAKGSEIAVTHTLNTSTLVHGIGAELNIVTKGEFGFGFNDKSPFTPLFKLGRIKTGFLSFKPPRFRPLAEITTLSDNNKNENFFFFDDDPDQNS